MLEKKISENTWILRLLSGEELLTELKGFCVREDIRLGYFTGIGALSEAELGVFLHDEKRYDTKIYTGSLEIIALHGNITTLDDVPFLHTHLGLSDEAMAMHGGHLYKAVVHPTAEIFLHAYGGNVSRMKDDESGLNLIAL